MAPSRKGRLERGGCGGAGRCWLRLCCGVSCSSSTLWSMSLLCWSCFGVLPVIVQDRGCGPDSAARGVPQLQFLDQVVTCLLFRRQEQFLDTVETIVVVQRQVLGL